MLHDGTCNSCNNFNNNYMKTKDSQADTVIMCQVKIKDNHNAFYFGDVKKKPCNKIATHIMNGTHCCEKHFNRIVKKINRVSPHKFGGL